MNREKLAWLVSVGFVAIAAMQIPGSLASRDDDYTFVRTLVDIHRQVANNYVEPVEEDKLREASIEGMLGELDPFSVFVPPQREEDFMRLLEGSFKGVGIQLDQPPGGGPVEVVSPIDGSPAFKAGVMAGDVILKVNGESIEGLRLPEVVKKIGGKLGTQVRLTVRHTTGEEAELTMMREEIEVPTVKGYQRKLSNDWDYYVCDDPKIAYLRITQFTSKTFGDFKGALEPLLSEGMRGLILDLRFNPGGRLESAVETVDLLIDKGTIVSTRGRNRPEHIEYAKAPGTLPYFPMIVLINEYSASASEIVAGSLMDNKRAVVIGQRSYGKGSVQELIPLDNKGGELKLTVAYYYLPSGRLVHKKKDATDWGVQPQITVPMDPAQEKKAALERYESELFRRPMPKSTTKSATTPATTQASSDTQLQRAIDTMVALVVLLGDREGVPPNGAPLLIPSATTPTPASTSAPVPASTPVTQPATTTSAPTSAPGGRDLPNIIPGVEPGGAIRSRTSPGTTTSPAP